MAATLGVNMKWLPEWKERSRPSLIVWPLLSPEASSIHSSDTLAQGLLHLAVGPAKIPDLRSAMPFRIGASSASYPLVPKNAIRPVNESSCSSLHRMPGALI